MRHNIGHSIVYLFSLKGLCLKLVPPSFVIIIIKNEATLPSVIYFCSADEKRFILFFSPDGRQSSIVQYICNTQQFMYCVLHTVHNYM